jgi:Zn-dependent oligopeptidase
MDASVSHRVSAFQFNDYPDVSVWYASPDGMSVARDFVEAPSQMLGETKYILFDGLRLKSWVTENWCYNAKVMKEISKHHESGEPMPDDLINKIIDSRFVNQGLYNLSQLFYGKFDLTVHGQTAESEREPHPSARQLMATLTKHTSALDYTKLWDDLREQVCII